MAAPHHIPNLLSLGRGRGRGRGGNNRPGQAPIVSLYGSTSLHGSATPPPAPNPQDRIVQQTDVDASDSRFSAVMLGYLNDEYAPHFNQQSIRRQPIINRGTYIRTTAIDQLVYAFLKQNDGRRKQIISLGAGSDTRFWRLKEDARHHDLIYHEIDFPDITAKKMQIISQTPDLAIDNDSLYRLEPKSHGNYYSPKYSLHGLDLRNLPESLPVLKQDCPTLLISECCLCYLDPADASKVIDYFTTQIPTMGIIVYEPTNPTSSFGQMMKDNLAARGIYMPTLEVYGSLEAQRERLRRAGFEGGQQAADIEWLFRKWISRREKERLDRIEILDEVEEWELLAKHYVIAWAFRDPQNEGAFNEWDNICPGPGSRPGY